MRRYAEKTSVPVARSRAEIDRLLRDWRCDGVQWTDEFSQGRVALAFIWSRDRGKGVVERYQARMTLKMPTGESVAEARRRRALHRTLLIWLKAAFNAIDAGLVTAEQLFLPFLVGNDGRTVGEIAIPNLTRLLDGAAGRLLEFHP
jgi:hypothetical protein